MTLQLVGRRSSAIPRQVEARLGPATPEVAVVLGGRFDLASIDYLLGRIVFATRREPFDIEILVLDDGTVANLRQRVEVWEEDFPVRWVGVSEETRTAAAIVAELEETAAEIFVVLDADLSYPPESIPRLIREIRESGANVVIGKRSSPGGPARWLRTVLSWTLVGISDPFSGMVAFRREALSLRTESPVGAHFGLDLLAAAMEEGESSEIGVAHDPVRVAGSGRSIRDLLKSLHQFATVALGHRAVEAIPSLLVSIGAVTLADLVLDPVSGPGATFLGPVIAAIVGLVRLPSHLLQGSGLKATAARATVVVVLAVLLRWAVLETLAAPPALSSQWARLLIVGSGYLTILLGFVFVALQGSTDPGRDNQRSVLAAGFVVGYAFVLRWVFAAGVTLIKEESYYWNYAQHLALSYLDHPPLSGWGIALTTGVFGDTEWAVRLPAIASWTIAALFLFGLAKNLSGRRVAAQTALLFSVLPIYFGIGLIITPDAPLHATWAGCLYFLERAVIDNRSRAWWGFGVCLGLGLLAKYTIVLLLPALLVYLLVDRDSRRWLWSRQVVGALVVGAALTTPIWVWNFQNEWASLLYQGPRRWAGGQSFSLGHLVLACAAILTPLGLMSALQVVWPRGSRARKVAGPRRELWQRQQLFAQVFTWIPLSVFILHSLIKLPKINWTGPVWMMALPLMAGAWARDSRTWPRRGLNSLGFAVVTLLILGSVLQWRLVGSPGLGDDHREDFLAWREIGREVDRVRAAITRETSREPVVVGMDISEISSQLSFYDPGATRGNVAGRHLLGEWSEGFGYWLNPKEVVGRDLILIGFDRSDLEKASVATLFADLGPVESLATSVEREAAPVLFYRVGYGYKGIP